MKATIKKLEDLFARNGIVDTSDQLEHCNITGELIACVSEIANAVRRIQAASPALNAAAKIAQSEQPTNPNSDAAAWGSFYDTNPMALTVLSMRNMLVSSGVCEVTGALIAALEQLADAPNDAAEGQREYLRETRRRLLEALSK